MQEIAMYTQTGMPGGMGMALPGMMQPPMMMPQMLQEGGEVGPPTGPPMRRFTGERTVTPSGEMANLVSPDQVANYNERLRAIEDAYFQVYQDEGRRNQELSKWQQSLGDDPYAWQYEVARQAPEDIVNFYRTTGIGDETGRPTRNMSIDELRQLTALPSIRETYTSYDFDNPQMYEGENLNALLAQLGSGRTGGIGQNQQNVGMGAGTTMYVTPSPDRFGRPVLRERMNELPIEVTNYLRNQSQDREYYTTIPTERKAGGEIPMPYMMASRPKQRMAPQQQQQPEMELAIAVMAPQQQEMPSVDALLDELDDKEVQALYAALETRIANRNKK